MQKIIVAGIQIACIPNNIPGNVRKAIQWLELAKAQTNCHLAVFPETITTGFIPEVPITSSKDIWALVEPIPGPTTDMICQAAKRMGVYVAWPTYERGAKEYTIYNSCALISPQGNILGIYRKTHPFPSERVWTTPGYETPVFKTDMGTIGIVICYDGDFPELSRVLTLKGAEIILRPSAFLRPFDIWSLTNMARAYDNHVYVVAVNAVGTDAGGGFYFGNSMIVSPIAQKLAQARSQEEILYASLDPNPLGRVSYGTDTPMLFNHIEDRNVAAYQGILHSSASTFQRRQQ